MKAELARRGPAKALGTTFLVAAVVGAAVAVLLARVLYPVPLLTVAPVRKSSS